MLIINRPWYCIRRPVRYRNTIIPYPRAKGPIHTSLGPSAAQAQVTGTMNAISANGAIHSRDIRGVLRSNRGLYKAMNQAFSPCRFFLRLFLGRCPGWYEDAPLALKNIRNASGRRRAGWKNDL